MQNLNWNNCSRIREKKERVSAHINQPWSQPQHYKPPSVSSVLVGLYCRRFCKCWWCVREPPMKTPPNVRSLIRVKNLFCGWQREFCLLMIAFGETRNGPYPLISNDRIQKRNTTIKIDLFIYQTVFKTNREILDIKIKTWSSWFLTWHE